MWLFYTKLLFISPKTFENTLGQKETYSLKMHSFFLWKYCIRKSPDSRKLSFYEITHSFHCEVISTSTFLFDLLRGNSKYSHLYQKLRHLNKQWLEAKTSLVNITFRNSERKSYYQDYTHQIENNLRKR